MSRSTRSAGLFVLALSVSWACMAGQAKTDERGQSDSGSRFDSRESYILGTDDQIVISALDAEGIDGKAFRIGARGDIKVPLIGYVAAAGLTVRDLEQELTRHLRRYYLKPQVTVTVTEFRSQPVSVIGSVNTPGVQHLQGEKTLIQVLSMAGGLRQDAGNVAKITRRIELGSIPLPGATVDPTGQFSVAEVSLRDVLIAGRPEANILIRPHDVISVPRSEMVYVVGEVNRAGGFSLNDRETMTALQALSLAGGFSPDAKGKDAKILRHTNEGDDRTELPVDLKAIVQGKKDDFPLQADDILFVPSSTTKKIAGRGVEALIQAVTGVAIWRSAR